MRARPAVLLLTALTALVLALPAGAAACDPATAYPVVLRGESPDGVRWEQRFGVSRHGLNWFFNLDVPGGVMAGQVGTDRPAQILHADWTEEGDELLVAGIAPRRTEHVVIRLEDGRTLTTVARHARRAALRRHPRVDRWRFFGTTTTAPGKVVSVEALDDTGTRIAGERLAPAARAACGI